MLRMLPSVGVLDGAEIAGRGQERILDDVGQAVHALHRDVGGFESREPSRSVLRFFISAATSS